MCRWRNFLTPCAKAIASSAAANAGNTGNSTVNAPSDLVGVQVGAYTIEFIAPAKFNVYDPFGNLVGEGATGTAFASQIGFTITAGATAFAAGTVSPSPWP
jgi:hypothetical protein